MPGITVKVGGDMRDANSKLDRLKKNAKTVANEIASGFKFRIGQKMFDGAIAGARAVPGEIKKAIDAASDLEETVSKAGVVFEGSAGQMLEWSKDAAFAMGQSQKAALDGAATMGNLFRAMGIGADESARMSRRIIELSSDLASFNNTTPEDAVQALGAALRGESEPIRRYGVMLDDATLKARALSMGLYEGKGSLSPVTKAMAAYEEVLAQTTTAQGDFARTADGLANSQRIVSALIDDLRSEVGQAFLPVMQDLVNKLKEVDFEAVAASISRFTQVLIQLLPHLDKAALAFGAWKTVKIGNSVSTWVASMGEVAGAAKAGEAALEAQAAAVELSSKAFGKANGKLTKLLSMMGRVAKSAGPVAVGFAVGAIAGDAIGDEVDKYTNQIEELDDLHNKLAGKFDASELMNSATSKGQLSEVIQEIEKEKESLYKMINDIARDDSMFGAFTQETRIEQLKQTIAMLEVKQATLNGVTDTQISANIAAVEAENLRIKEAEAIKKASAEYANLKKEFDSLLKSGQQKQFGKLPVDEQITALEEMEKKARGKLNPALKLFHGDKSAAELQKIIDGSGEHKDKATDAAAALELLQIEQQLLDLREKKAELDDDAAAQREEEFNRLSDAAVKYHEELKMLEAQIDGNDKKLQQLEREKSIREEMEKLMKAGFSEADALSKAADLLDKRDEAEKAQKKRERVNELVEAGLPQELAEKINGSESQFEKLMELQEKKNNATGFDTTIADSRARIGGGGGVYDAGMSYQRQIAELNRQILEVLKNPPSDGGSGLFDR